MRLKRGMTQHQLADAIGLQLPGLQKIEYGRNKSIPFETLDKLCKALNCGPGELLGSEESGTLDIKTFELAHLQEILPLEGAIKLELTEGIPIFRASAALLERIEVLQLRILDKTLTPEESSELDRYGELDDYLSFVNRLIRNRFAQQ